MPVHDNLGTRMKENYEHISRTYLTRRVPVAIRIDGKAFHTFTRGFNRPFDEILSNAMQETMLYLCKNVQGCVFGYTQSDEITLILIDYKELDSDAWFGYNVQKMCSVSASMATMAFNKAFAKLVKEYIEANPVVEDSFGNPFYKDKLYRNSLLHSYNTGAMFDARAFNIPKEEVANLIYWRQLDAQRNSVQMVGQANFSHNELQKLTCNMIQNKLLTEKDINWNDYPTKFKRGSACVREINPAPILPNAGPNVFIDRNPWRIDNKMPMIKGEGRAYVNDRILYKED